MDIDVYSPVSLCSPSVSSTSPPSKPLTRSSSCPAFSPSSTLPSLCLPTSLSHSSPNITFSWSPPAPQPPALGESLALSQTCLCSLYNAHTVGFALYYWVSYKVHEWTFQTQPCLLVPMFWIKSFWIHKVVILQGRHHPCDSLDISYSGSVTSSSLSPDTPLPPSTSESQGEPITISFPSNIQSLG